MGGGTKKPYTRSALPMEESIRCECREIREMSAGHNLLLMSTWGLRLVEEAEKPEWNFVVTASHFGVVACQNDVGVAFYALAAVAHLNVRVVVDTVDAVALSFVDRVVTPQGVGKESLHDGLLRNLWRVDGIEQVGIVEEHGGRLLGETLVFFVDEVDQTGFFEILQIVHHRGARSTDFFGKTAHVGSRGVAHSKEIEQFLDALEIFEFDLLDEEDVDFDHRIHRTEKLLCEVTTFEEERIVAVVEILLEVFPRTHLRQDALEDRLVVFEQFLEGIGAEVFTCAQVDKLTEGETMQPILLCKGVELSVVVVASAHRSGGVDDAQIREAIVAFDDLLAPIGEFEGLVNQ